MLRKFEPASTKRHRDLHATNQCKQACILLHKLRSGDSDVDLRTDDGFDRPARPAPAGAAARRGDADALLESDAPSAAETTGRSDAPLPKAGHTFPFSLFLALSRAIFSSPDSERFSSEIWD